MTPNICEAAELSLCAKFSSREVHKQGKQSRKSVETMDTYQSSFDGGDDLLQSPTKADAKQTSSLEEECEAINLLSECSMEQLLHAAGLEVNHVT